MSWSGVRQVLEELGGEGVQDGGVSENGKQSTFKQSNIYANTRNGVNTSSKFFFEMLSPKG